MAVASPPKPCRRRVRAPLPSGVLDQRVPDDPRVPVFLLTGGPCGGKTSALHPLRAALEARGWGVLVAPEVATHLYTNGVNPRAFTGDRNIAFRRELVRAILRHEATWRTMAALMPGDRHVLLLDRGVLDDFPYVGSWPVYERLLAEVGLSRDAAFARYDAVFHLVSTADGAEHAYGVATNSARQEDVLAARHADALTREAWCSHPRWHLIPNRDRDPHGNVVALGWSAKLERLIATVAHELSEWEARLDA